MCIIYIYMYGHPLHGATRAVSCMQLHVLICQWLLGGSGFKVGGSVYNFTICLVILLMATRNPAFTS